MLPLLLAAWCSTSSAVEDPEITVHLLHVAATLRAETPVDLPDDVKARRLGLLDALESYASAGDVPDNVDGVVAPPRRVQPTRRFEGTGERAPIFVDDRGTHCAVGYLLALDRPDLRDAVVAEANLAWLPEIEVEGLAAWADWAGFTTDDLAWIQPTYGPWETTLPRCEGWAPAPRPSDRPASDCAVELVPRALDLPTTSFGGDAQFPLCAEHCGGPIRLGIAIENRGYADATGVEVSVWTAVSDPGKSEVPDELLHVLPPVDVPAGEVVFLTSEPIPLRQARRGVVWSADHPDDCSTAPLRATRLDGFRNGTIRFEDCAVVVPDCRCGVGASRGGALVGLLTLVLATRRRRGHGRQRGASSRCGC